MLADAGWVWIILVRWLHVIAACLLVGATFFAAFILPTATRTLETATAAPVASRSRRGFKMLVHVCILLVLGSGTYNLIVNRDAYHQTLPLSHALLGTHVLLALAVFTILLVALSGREQRRGEQKWLALTVVVLLLTVLLASGLKYVREHPRHQPNQVSS